MTVTLLTMSSPDFHPYSQLQLLVYHQSGYLPKHCSSKSPLQSCNVISNSADHVVPTNYRSPYMGSYFICPILELPPSASTTTLLYMTISVMRHACYCSIMRAWCALSMTDSLSKSFPFEHSRGTLAGRARWLLIVHQHTVMMIYSSMEWAVPYLCLLLRLYQLLRKSAENDLQFGHVMLKYVHWWYYTVIWPSGRGVL